MILEMKSTCRRVSLSRLCWLLGVSRQAVYQHCWRSEELSGEEDLVLGEVRRLREEHPVLGTRKLQVLLQPFLLEHAIKIGRDALFDLLAGHGLLVRKTRRSVRTTVSVHRFKKYPNLTEGWHPARPGELWVADITYVPLAGGFLYLSLLTDAYSHKVVGYHIAATLDTVHTLEALRMALQHHPPQKGLIHHSDRGVQYCSRQYVEALHARGVRISMTQSGDPLENPVAERINGIIKNEYLKYYALQNETQAQQLLHRVIRSYNENRPHQSLQMLTPEVVHTKALPVNKTWSKTKKQIPCQPITGLTEPL